MAPERKTKIPLLLGVLLALALGGGGFFAAWSGMLPGIGAQAPATAGPDPLPDIGFVAMEPIIVALGPAAGGRFLKFTAQLEVARPHMSEVNLLMPRIVDVLNGYLRAISVSEIEDPGAMARLRAQMLRRVQIVTGEGRVRDLLVNEFILN
ncbi:flagellar basal body-associated FliL family protein [Rhodobacteraceae bacterium PA1-206B]